MLETVKNAFKIKDIRNKLIYTLIMLVVVRLGCELPVPGVDRSYFANWFAQQTGDAFNFMDAFTGGSFLNMSVFALNITPYITSSIIMQLLTIAIPKLEEMQREGEDGRKKIASITRYVTVGLALMESSAMAIGFGRQGLLDDFNALNVIMVITALTAGSAFIMWIGERITENGVGNGISIVLTINIISRIPEDLRSLWKQFVTPQFEAHKYGAGTIAIAIIAAVIIVTVILTVILNGAERRIPVQYAKKVQGRKMVGGQSSHIPLKVNTGGVIPIIFASSLMQLPSVISSFFGSSKVTWWQKFMYFLNSGNWFKRGAWQYTWGALIYIVLVVFFAYFYTSITFNPMEVAENMKKSGGFIPGTRPGKPTQDYLNKVLNYIVFIGAVGLIIVALIPIIFNGLFGASVSFGGTSLIIIVGVILETMKQIESQMLVRNYKGFLN
ncbi:MAG: preprotein translocase subunit SecY [Lachnospiraceae bacterium]|nr:preprotein translocase subunit SecY [Lachnospiraceae bacterium]MBQ8006860.1 preprotein translocase subunit SecY [Lachnospiraceae bacterium]MBR1451650.1 preprotein translocase subunit SecY [Lachnospiraceae bacterium]